MNARTLTLTIALTALLVTGPGMESAPAQVLPAGYWSLQQAREILDQTRTITLDPDLTSLTAAEQAAVEKLLRAGGIFQRIYEDSMHPQALESLNTVAGPG